MGSNPVSVDDGDPCTTDSCDPVLGVQHVPVTDNPNCAQWYSGGLKVEVKTNYCDLQKVQQYFQVTNTGASPVNLSDISIKYWVYDTTGANVVSDIYYPGCVVTSPSNLTCEHPLTGVSTLGTQFPACGSDANHQANWEVTLTPTDSYALQPGHQWNNLQTVVHLDSWATFTPGTSQWYSTCLTSSSYATDSHFSVYYKGNLVFASGINAPSCKGPSGTQRLTGYLTRDTIAGPVPVATKIQLAVGLPMSDPTGLKNFVHQVSDPASPTFRQYKTSNQLTEEFGPQQTDYDLLVSWAKLHSLAILNQYPNRILLDVTGTASAIEQALCINLNYYVRADGSQYYAPDREPSLDLLPSVSGITRLNDVAQRIPAFRTGTDGYSAIAIRSAYVSGTLDSGLDGNGQCIGIAAWGESFVDSDINEYMTQFSGLPSSYALNYRVEHFPVDGFDRTQYLRDTIETSSDIEMALAMAPAAAVIVYEGSDISSVFNSMLTDSVNNCNQFSVSYVAVPAFWISYPVDVMQPIIDNAVGNGKSIYQCSGDWGAYIDSDNHIWDPGGNLDFDNTTIVGGTVLSNDANGIAWSETAWSYAGAGYELNVPTPDYQTTVNTTGFGRSIPDVSAVAQGVQVVASYTGSVSADCSNIAGAGQTLVVNGTSLSAPLWAGYTALVNQQRAGHLQLPVGFGLNAANAVSGGVQHTCALFPQISNGSVMCWGDNTVGELGNGTTIASLTPVTVTGLTGVKNITSAMTGTTCATLFDGSAKCWGGNLFGVLGNGSTTDSNVPVVVSNLTGVLSMSSGGEHTCALLTGSVVKCWDHNIAGQLGDGTNVDRLIPVSIMGNLQNVVGVAAGGSHTCVLLATGEVNCWGDNSERQLGNGATSSSNVPVSVVGVTDAISIVAGSAHACALAVGGTVKCWGANHDGRLGNGTTSDSNTPVDVTGLSNANAIAAGVVHTCALTWNGNVQCWGDGTVGQLGNGTSGTGNYSDTPVLVQGLP